MKSSTYDDSSGMPATHEKALCGSVSAKPEDEAPYLYVTVTQVHRKHNPNFGDDRKCQCGHTYYRHFDSYDEMYPCGCKYCECDEFKEAKADA
jgi:hypothetical protein